MFFEQIGKSITPNLVLTGVTYEELLEKYINKEFVKILTIPYVVTIKHEDFIFSIGEHKIIKPEEKSSTVYIAKLEKTPSLTYENILSNNWWVKEASQTGQKGIFCLFCNRMSENMIGVPLRINSNYFNDVLTIETEGLACNLSCAYSYCKKFDESCIAPKFYLTSSRSRVVKLVHELLYSGETLREAYDPLILKCYGGQLTNEQYDEGTKVLRKTVNSVDEVNFQNVSHVYN